MKYTAILLFLVARIEAFQPTYRTTRVPSTLRAESEDVLEKVRQLRAEIAKLEGKTIEQVEQEANEKKQNEAKLQEQRESETLKRKSEPRQMTNGSFLEVPETAEDEVYQARLAIERAFKDGINRQIVRFALIPEGEVLNEDRQWPGGAQQMYREAAGPLTREVLKQIKAPTGKLKDSPMTSFANNVTSQDVWDFDGSAIVTAISQAGPEADVQALVQPNTDTKYLKDIQRIDQVMKDRLFLLVNPFWRNLESWGFNLLAMNAKKLADEVIFQRGYQETYCCIQKTVRGEDCVALKAYPYDWQIYAYLEQDYWPYKTYPVRLGSSVEEPTSDVIGKLLEERDEFKLSKNMRNLQRMMGNSNE